MTGNLNAKWSDFPAALTVGAQVLLIDADPLSLSNLARVLAPVVDLAVTNSADSALESIEAGAQFDALVCSMTRVPELSARDLQDRVARIDAPLARRMLVLAGATVSLEDAEFLASGRVPVLRCPICQGRLISLVRALIARAARRRLALLDGFQPVSRGLRACGSES
jgi:CheY-like chemotaxis protein